jgi:uncharacterized protein
VHIVLDSNIVVSSYIVPLGAPARIVTAWHADRFVVIVSEPLLSEYERSLNYPRVRRRHGLTPEQVAREIVQIRELALMVVPQSVPRVVADDPDDDQIVAAAVAGQATYIVSGDRHLLDLSEYQGIRILSPAVFLPVLAEEEFRRR